MVKIAIQCDGSFDKGFGNRWAAAKRAGADGLGVTIRTARHLHDLGRRDYAARLRASADEHGLSMANLRVGDALVRRIEASGDGPAASSEAIIRLAAWVAAEADIPCVWVPITGHIRSKRSADLLQAMCRARCVEPVTLPA